MKHYSKQTVTSSTLPSIQLSKNIPVKSNVVTKAEKNKIGKKTTNETIVSHELHSFFLN